MGAVKGVVHLLPGLQHFQRVAVLDLVRVHRRAHQMCSVEMCPWRIDFSRVDWAAIASKGRETSMRRLRLFFISWISLQFGEECFNLLNFGLYV